MAGSEIAPQDIHRIEPQTVKLERLEGEGGWILDIGGGGEGIVGHLEGSRVVAIDLLRSELEEANNPALKIIMDARELKFLDGTFSTATAFFSFMFMPPSTLDQVMSEIARVLAPGGAFHLWDFSFAVPEGFDKRIVAVPLTVVMPDGRSVETGYGCRPRDQDMEGFIALGRRHGLIPVRQERAGQTFYVRFQKG